MDGRSWSDYLFERMISEAILIGALLFNMMQVSANTEGKKEFFHI